MKNMYEECTNTSQLLDAFSRFCDKLGTKTFWELVEVHDKIDPSLEFLSMISAAAIIEKMSYEMEKGLEIVQ